MTGDLTLGCVSEGVALNMSCLHVYARSVLWYNGASCSLLCAVGLLGYGRTYGIPVVVSGHTPAIVACVRGFIWVVFRVAEPQLRFLVWLLPLPAQVLTGSKSSRCFFRVATLA